ncbi:MAG: hypothetical protein JWO77_3404, partial [Ilumatobacteraceae bacterium]|nr:hypothetical protein [Ilumatobacteraceae bacterium]
MVVKGEVCQGRVTAISAFGADVEIDGGGKGLLKGLTGAPGSPQVGDTIDAVVVRVTGAGVAMLQLRVPAASSAPAAA